MIRYLNMRINNQLLNELRNSLNNESNFSLSNELLFLKNGGKTIRLSKKGNKQKIKIKESQKGSFTRYCGGNVTAECISRGKNSPDPKIRKKATFAANVRKWNK